MEPAEYDRIAELEEHHWWYLGMRSIAQAWVEDIAARRRAGEAWDILDAGCGAGGGMRWLAEFGRVRGIDLNSSATRYSRRASSEVAQASVQALPIVDCSIDLVTSFEVLYHLAVTDDRAAMAEAARVLKPGGWFLVRVPAYDWLRGAHDRQVHTRHRYGRGELQEKLSSAGLNVHRLSGAGLSILPPAILVRLLQGSRPAASDVTLPSPVANRFLLSLLSLESRWLRRHTLPAGLSLIALARKPVAEAPFPQRGKGRG
jgi:SAM-dependent methyltransferase